MIYSALFEGNTTRQLPKIKSFFVRLFGFLNFLLEFFKYLKSLKKNKISLKLQTRRRHVSNRKTNQFQVAEHTFAQCKDICVGQRHSGESPLSVKIGNQAAKDIQNGSVWLDMRQVRAIWLILKVREADISLNEVGKAHDNAITT